MRGQGLCPEVRGQTIDRRSVTGCDASTAYRRRSRFSWASRWLRSGSAASWLRARRGAIGDDHQPGAVGGEALGCLVDELG